MRRFEIRDGRQGVVAEGVEFKDGRVAMHFGDAIVPLMDISKVVETLRDRFAVRVRVEIIWLDDELRGTAERLLKRALECPPSEGTDCALAAIHALGRIPTQ